LRFLSYDQQIRIPTNIKGSSFFKNKENPTLEETLIQASMDVIGQTTKVDLCLQEGELDLNVFDFFAGFSLLECLPRYRTIIEKYTRHSLEKICLPN
jgi:aspartate ammonia-lyase